jgi:hypothetical protein
MKALSVANDSYSGTAQERLDNLIRELIDMGTRDEESDSQPGTTPLEPQDHPAATRQTPMGKDAGIEEEEDVRRINIRGGSGIAGPESSNNADQTQQESYCMKKIEQNPYTL